MFGRDAFRVELHAVNGKVAVLHAHDRAIRQPGRHFQLGRQAFAVDHQRMIARRLERRGQARKHTFAVMVNVGDFAVHDLVAAHHGAAKGLTDGLMPQTDAQQGGAGFRRRSGQCKADARMIGVRGAGRQRDCIRVQRHGLLHIQRIIAMHDHIGVQLAKIMHEIIGKAVIVIDKQKHRQGPESVAIVIAEHAARGNSRSVTCANG
ncbi:hypothetical protein KVU_0610 [Ketogulonicigenium vulgare WSH-001]|uniref:Uncharacterized protein n=1 Tax=Ketogulonicigenium vulgare (strain WSH-001) TaxID=759362 RepID=F9Y3T5_KETVW|nr:hypothetical protein KVU_0610 [Ketogulonicigenium vulgare WSH-001]